MDYSVSLYIHVPFCARKCRYCDFYSVVGRGPVQGRIVDETLQQIDRFLTVLGPAPRIETVYVGGGTPSLLDPQALDRLLGRIAPLAPSEWTVEANPESLGKPFLRSCAAAGVTRLSVGLQSMEDRHLRLLGRPGNREDNRRALALLDRWWQGELNLDLIAGIPGQTADGLEADVATAVSTGRGHVSLYSLTVEAGTALARMIAAGSIKANPREHDDELWLQGKAQLEAAGLRGYEISNFAVPGKECRHNLRYWRLEPYAGAGPGAVSTLPRETAEAVLGGPLPGVAPVVRLSNARALAPGIEAEEVSGPSFLLETLMMGLRLADGIDAASFRRRFGAGLEVILPGLWSGWVARGLAEGPGQRIRLREPGRLVLDRLLAEAAERIRALPQESLRIDWPPAD